MGHNQLTQSERLQSDSAWQGFKEDDDDDDFYYDENRERETVDDMLTGVPKVSTTNDRTLPTHKLIGI